jgi:hypothetical protein
MKASLEFSPELIDLIADRVVEKMKPFMQIPEQEDEILSIDGVVRLIWGNQADIEKKRGQVYQWVNNSKYGLDTFPYMKAGKSLRFSKNAVLQWMKNNGKPLEGR